MTDPAQARRMALDYVPQPSDFAGRVLLVTGATQGLGRAIASDLVRQGANVILHGRSERKLDELHGELLSHGPETSVAQLDLERAQGEQYMELTRRVEERYGRLDGLLHNAAILGDRSPIEHYDIGVWQRVMHVNATAPFILTRCLLPLLHASDDARIVATSSSVGKRARAHWGAYCASKFALEAMTGILAEELANSKICCNIVNPGKTRTNMRRAAFPGEDPSKLPPPETLTGPFLYLLGAASRGINGARVDVQSY